MEADYLVLRRKMGFREEMSTSLVGCMIRLENLFDGI